MEATEGGSVTDYAVKPEHVALARMIDREAFNLRTGAEKPYQIAAQLRLIAECLAPLKG